MKSCVAIALIVAGTVLILAPFVLNTMATACIAMIMAEVSKDVQLRADVPRWYNAVCAVAGIAMILTGTISALKSKGDDERSSTSSRE